MRSYNRLYIGIALEYYPSRRRCLESRSQYEFPHRWTKIVVVRTYNNIISGVRETENMFLHGNKNN